MNKSIVLFAVPNIPENNNNMRLILGRIGFWRLKCWVVPDHKMKNILCGMQSHGCSFPCVNCKSRQKKVPVDSLNYLGEPRTLQSLAIDYENYVAAGCPKKDAQDKY